MHICAHCRMVQVLLGCSNGKIFQRRSKGPSRSSPAPRGPVGSSQLITFFCKMVSHMEYTTLIVLTPKDTLFMQIGVALIHQLPYPVVSHVSEQDFF